jgi:endonuclease YncB( thermonuclease family)
MRGILICLLLSSISLAACGPGSDSLTSQAARATPLPPQVVVLNADSLVIDGKPIRLANAEAPQPLSKSRCWSEAVASRQGRRVVKRLFLDAQHVQVLESGARDVDNRTLAEVRLDGLDLGETLLQTGLAVRPASRPFDWCGPVSTQMTQGLDLAALGDLRP